mmetsp:Transcript_37221/g.82795  ORF Transcript_37221/g.82795 Transcript_37221/m.82795 type:complete len:373 (+) Transcript_37221:415-1533(+)
MLKSSRKMRQSRSVMSARGFSLQCFSTRMSKPSYLSASLSRSRSARRVSLVSSIPAAERASRRMSFSTVISVFFCSRRSMPARMPRPKSSMASCVWAYRGLRSLLVSSPASQSKLNLNFSLGRITFFFCFSCPRYCCLISSSSFSFSRCSCQFFFSSPWPPRSLSRSLSLSRSRSLPRSRSRSRSLSRSSRSRLRSRSRSRPRSRSSLSRSLSRGGGGGRAPDEEGAAAAAAAAATGAAAAGAAAAAPVMLARIPPKAPEPARALCSWTSSSRRCNARASLSFLEMNLGFAASSSSCFFFLSSSSRERGSALGLPLGPTEGDLGPFSGFTDASRFTSTLTSSALTGSRASGLLSRPRSPSSSALTGASSLVG